MKKSRNLPEISKLTGLDHEIIVSFIERKWICPEQDSFLDEEDIARIRLIEELRHDFGANEEAIPLILHLLDQVCYFREQLRKLGNQGQ